MTKKCPFCAEDIQDAAIVCKHCRRELPRAAAAPENVSHKHRWWARGIVGVLLFAAWYHVRGTEPPKPASSVPPPTVTQAAETHTSVTKPPTEAKIAAMKVSLEAIEKFQSLGDITKWDPATGDCFVKSGLWQMMTYQQKKSFVKSVSLAREAVRDLPQVTIRDAHTGHELASFGVFAGVTIE